MLTWTFKKAHDLTISVLTGFLIGSLNKIWPWKIIDEVFVKHKGTDKEEIVPLVQHNVLPHFWSEMNGVPDQLFPAIVLCITGFALIMVLDRWSPENNKA